MSIKFNCIKPDITLTERAMGRAMEPCIIAIIQGRGVREMTAIGRLYFESLIK